ncbi:hypothetical protein L0F63_006982, partial [Massospora cicadina]
LKYMSKSGVHACDQCRARRARCDRQLPTCSSCVERKLACTLNREFTYSTHVTYQNVSTFSVAKRERLPRTRARPPRKLPKSGGDLLFTRLNSSSSPLLLETSQLNRWFNNSYSRFILNYFIKLSGIPLAVASARDIRFLSEMLESHLNAMSLGRKMILPLEAGGGTRRMLAEATDAYFHYFNPYHLLFLRHEYDARPRAELLRLSVWRAGLQFLAPTPERRALADHLDTQLLEYTRPSQLRVRLHVLQSFLILSLGLVDSRILRRIAVFRDSLVSFIYALGIHVRASSLEAVLAYRLCIARDIRYTLTMGTTPHFATDFSRDVLYPPRTAANSCIRMLKSFDAVWTAPEPGPAWCDKPLEPAVGSARLHTALSLAVDTCALVVNDCLYENSVIQQKASQTFTWGMANASHVHATIAWADRRLFTCFRGGISKLRRMRVEVKSRILGYVHTISPNHGADLRFSLKVFDQFILFLATQYLNSRLYIVSFGAHIDPKAPEVITPRPNTSHVTPLITSCLKTAMSLLQLLDRIGSAPFCHVKSAPLSKAYILIAQHYHTYCRHYQTQQCCKLLESDPSAMKSTPLQAKFDASLLLARSLLVSLLPCPITGFFARNSIIYFDAFLAHHKIVLPNHSHSKSK